MKISEIISYLESLAPLSSQENYDNSGLITGSKTDNITNALISLDCTEAVVEEAIRRNCNLIISHHPIVFKGLKKITGKTYVERVIIKAIQNNIAIYACHTNLDNFQNGVNRKIGEKLGLKNMHILEPVQNKLIKLAVYVPTENTEKVAESLFSAGAGQIGNYSHCAFRTEGTGSFKANESANPYVGKHGEKHFEKEQKLEVLFSAHKLNSVLTALKISHPYEEVAYDLFPVLNENPTEGAGMFADLDEPVSEKSLLDKIKKTFNTGSIRHTTLLNKEVKRIAWCGGSGSFLLQKAKQARADIFITGDFKYHDFFDADNQIVIADIGHFESEQFTIELIKELLQEKFPTFAPCLAETNTNPVNYY
ncbi:MAG: Nif3-like dinuclear metal center hexameric protein [Crocinitomicaceae bacterium]|nr:Nif3-like dinuclear metal center hexameric protein [Crocinitomicaceae bacterium]